MSIVGFGKLSYFAPEIVPGLDLENSSRVEGI